jgi:hypothetical protein
MRDRWESDGKAMGVIDLLMTGIEKLHIYKKLFTRGNSPLYYNTQSI